MAHMVKGRQYNIAQSILAHAMPQSLLNHKDDLNRSTVDLNSRQKRQIDVSVIKTNSAAQYRSIRYVAS